MRERHVPRPLRVERPQHGQVRVDGVAALHADQGGHLAAAEGGFDVVGASAEGLQSGVKTFEYIATKRRAFLYVTFCSYCLSPYRSGL